MNPGPGAAVPQRVGRVNLVRPTLVVFGPALLGAILGCGTSPPAPTASPTADAERPAVQIDQTWSATDGLWTFTGNVDPQGDATDVVLEIGPGPANARRFDRKVPVQQGLVAAGPLSIATREIPDIDEICVRFTATNSGGTSSSAPLCFPHDLPTFAPAGAPTVTIDPKWTAANGGWTFIGRVDPMGEPTDVVLEIGPASAGPFDKTPVADGMTEAAKVEVTTRNVPATNEICARFTATNKIGSASSTTLCVPQALPSVNPDVSPGPS